MKDEEHEFFVGFWLPEHQALFDELKAEILTKPVLAWPNPKCCFYVKTDWAKFAMAAVLLQADPDEEQAADLKQIEAAGGPCFF